MIDWQFFMLDGLFNEWKMHAPFDRKYFFFFYDGKSFRFYDEKCVFHRYQQH